MSYHLLLLLMIVGCKSPPESRMITIPAGTYNVRCVGNYVAECTELEDSYEAEIRSFEIDATEVSREQYQQCVDANACQAAEERSGDTHPVLVQYADAESYCRWRRKELPLFVLWEIAARGKRGGNYPWGNESPTCDKIEFSSCLQARETEPVGSRPLDQSEFGVFDMWGSVGEWVASVRGELRMRPSGIHRPASDVHVYRASTPFSYQDFHVQVPYGFRCARGQQPPIIKAIDEH